MTMASDVGSFPFLLRSLQSLGGEGRMVSPAGETEAEGG